MLEIVKVENTTDVKEIRVVLDDRGLDDTISKVDGS